MRISEKIAKVGAERRSALVKKAKVRVALGTVLSGMGRSMMKRAQDYIDPHAAIPDSWVPPTSDKRVKRDDPPRRRLSGRDALRAAFPIAGAVAESIHPAANAVRKLTRRSKHPVSVPPTLPNAPSGVDAASYLNWLYGGNAGTPGSVTPSSPSVALASKQETPRAAAPAAAPAAAQGQKPGQQPGKTPPKQPVASPEAFDLSKHPVYTGMGTGAGVGAMAGLIYEALRDKDENEKSKSYLARAALAALLGAGIGGAAGVAAPEDVSNMTRVVTG